MLSIGSPPVVPNQTAWTLTQSVLHVPEAMRPSFVRVAPNSRVCWSRFKDTVLNKQRRRGAAKVQLKDRVVDCALCYSFSMPLVAGDIKALSLKDVNCFRHQD